MARKTKLQKLRTQVRELKNLRANEHQLAGTTINFEMQALQSVAIAHGIMATQLEAKRVLGEDSPEFQAINTMCVARISQCVLTLMNMGFSFEVANQRILAGH